MTVLYIRMITLWYNSCAKSQSLYLHRIRCILLNTRGRHAFECGDFGIVGYLTTTSVLLPQVI
jgi:hypothetical protein